MTAASIAGTPLEPPLYGATFGQAVSRYLRKYAVFSGRASRSEFWWVALFQIALSVALGVLIASVAGATAAAARGTGAEHTGLVIGLVIVLILWLALIVPSIAITVRRLHDANFSGWFILLHFVPYVGGLIVLVLNVLPTNPAGARFDR